MSDAIRILLADDHPLVTEGVRAVLETYPQIEVVATVTKGTDAMEAIASYRPDVTLMDLNMPGMNGLTATERTLEQDPEARIIILSMHDNPEYISTALGHGARGYLLKDVATEEIVHAIEEVHAGRTYLCTGTQGAVTTEGDDTREPLTSREQMVLLRLARGLSNKEVARDLDISVRTVETHRKNIKRKLSIDTTAGLTRYVLESGLLGLED
ncbi:response regulator transcription factor [Pontivivens insulae]|uniref:Oxygen regulatory protein NreC n=1 Tax=Pontivivens insulae TaxID=1639689 RepID=A0A2R8AAY4_9RHOB|nr:response regulator transcription factor [Pontivivens insulae]RED13156.1 LuxR family two component transcriptional regulator [Pontivivens insulae]SPF29248.1 Oxygen regulatory protein NreC [Pontivivens insulae]